jgi:maltose O-acetyltransferase
MSRSGVVQKIDALKRLPSKVRWRLRGEQNLDELRRRGVRLGPRVYIGAGTFIDIDFAWLVSIGERSVLSAGVMVLAHDASTKMALGYSRVAPVEIGERVFVGARSVILPGVRVGDDAIIGAGSVVRHDIPAGTVAAGNPAKPIAQTVDYNERHRAGLETRPVWERDWLWDRITPEQREAMRLALHDGEGYVP